MFIKLLTVSALTLGLATSAMAQANSGEGTGGNSGGASQGESGGAMRDNSNMPGVTDPNSTGSTSPGGPTSGRSDCQGKDGTAGNSTQSADANQSPATACPD